MRKRHKKFHYPPFLAAIVCLAVVSWFSIAAAATGTAYVSDECEITFRRGAGNEFKILRMLKSGAQVEVLSESPDGWSQVKLEDGAEGYVLTRFLKSEEPLSRQAGRLQTENETLKSTTQNLKQTNDALTTENSRLKTELASAKNNLQKVQEDYDQLKLNAKDVVSVTKELQNLKQQHEKLEKEYHTAKVEQEEGKEMQLWLLFGAGILVFGIIVGVISRRSSSRQGMSRLR
jgi:SH3 domain protein